MNRKTEKPAENAPACAERSGTAANLLARLTAGCRIFFVPSCHGSRFIAPNPSAAPFPR